MIIKDEIASHIVEDATSDSVAAKNDNTGISDSWRIAPGNLGLELLNASRAEETAQWAARRHEQGKMVAHRLEHGFVHEDQGQSILGRTREAFQEQGLRSERLGRSGELFVRGLRRAKDLRGGDCKAMMRWMGPNKLLALDAPYIEGNREMVSLIRIDLDFVFLTPDHAISAIRSVVDAGQLPCMPHLICGDVAPRWVDVDGEKVLHRTALANPHLWVVLEAAVNCGPKGRSKPKRLLAGVSRGICKALLPWGADPNASVRLVRGKNPLCPYLWAEALNNETWPSLTEWAEWVDTRIGREKLVRMAAEVQSGTGKAASNEAFNTWQQEAYGVLGQLHADSDPSYLKLRTTSGVDREGLAVLLRDHLPIDSQPPEPGWSEVQRLKVYNAVVKYAAGAWDPAKAGLVEKSRGAMRHLTGGMSKQQAQAASGQRSASIKADRALGVLTSAYRDVQAQGERPTQTAVAKRAGVSRTTASRRWDEVLQALAEV